MHYFWRRGARHRIPRRCTLWTAIYILVTIFVLRREVVIICRTGSWGWIERTLSERILLLLHRRIPPFTIAVFIKAPLSGFWRPWMRVI
jgi:hypothetical protein